MHSGLGCPGQLPLPAHAAVAGLGERGVPAEDIGYRAASELMDVIASGACTDEWLQVEHAFIWG